MSKKYEQAVSNLLQAIDIAIESHLKYTPKGWNQEEIDIVLNSYSILIEEIKNPPKGYRNMTSLKYSIQELFTYFQEASGPDVNYFGIKSMKIIYPTKEKI